MGKKMFRFIVTALVFLMLICVPASAATSSVTIAKGGTKQLKVKGTSIKKAVSSKKSVASVTNKGLVTAKKKGTAVITVTGKNNKKYKFHVTVEKPSLNKTSLTINQGKTYVLKLKNNTQKVKWSSSNKKVATVSSSGGVTAKSSGKAVITAKVPNGPSYKCRVTVKKVKAADTSSAPEEETEKQTLVSANTIIATKNELDTINTTSSVVNRAPAVQASGAGTGYRKVTIQPSGDTGVLNYSYKGSGSSSYTYYQKVSFGTYSASLEDGSDFKYSGYTWELQNSNAVDRYIKVADSTIKVALTDSIRLSRVASYHVYVVHSDESRDELGEDGNSSYGTITLTNPTTTANLTITLTSGAIRDDDSILIVVEYKRTYKNIRSELTFFNQYESPASIAFTTTEKKIINGTYSGAVTNEISVSEANYESAVIATTTDLNEITLELPSPIYIDKTKVKVYQCDAGGNRTELNVIVEEQPRVTYLGTDSDEKMRLKISGIGTCTDDIVIAAELKHAKSYIGLTVVGARKYDSYINPTLPGAISVGGNRGTQKIGASGDGITNFSGTYLYSGETYTISYDDAVNSSELLSAVLTYKDADGVIQTETFRPKQGVNNQIEFTMPFLADPYDATNNKLTLNYQYNRNSAVVTLDDENKGEVRITDTEQGAQSIFWYNGTQSYSEQSFTATRNQSYHLISGRTYKLESTYQNYDGNRLICTGFIIYQLNSDLTRKTDENGDYITYNEITGSGNVYTFTMPAYPVEIHPLYEEHLHSINVKVDTVGEIVGGVTLSGTEAGEDGTGGNHFFGGTPLYKNGKNNASLTWSSSNCYASDNQTYTLTPNFDPSAYRVTDVRAYYFTPTTTNYSNTYGFYGAAAIGNRSLGTLTQLTDDEITIINNNDTDGTWTITLPNGFAYKNIQIEIQVEKIPESFVKFTYALDGTSSSGGMTLNSKFVGKFVYTKAGDVTYPSTGTLTNASFGKVDLWNKWNNSKELENDEVQKNSVINVTLGYDAVQSETNAYRGSRLAYRNLIISLTDEQTDEVLSTFRYFDGDIYDLSGTNTSRVSTPETTQHFNEMLQSITFQVSVGENPLKLTIKYFDNYIPVTINQMIIEEDGNVREATETDGIETTISKYASGYTTAPAYQQKFFTNAYRAGDYYQASDLSTNYVSEFKVSGSRESRNMLTQYPNSGLLVTPPTSGSYVLAGISTKTLNRNGVEVATEDTNTTKKGITPAISYLSTQAANWVHFNSRLPLSQQLVVNVYYTKALTNLTVTEYDNTSTSKNKVVLSNYNTERDEPTMPYLLDHVDQYETYTINKTANSAGVSTNFGVNRDTGIQFEITPISTRNISEVRAYKLLENDVKQELEVERVSGSAYPGEKTTYRIVNYLATPGDDIHVEIIYDYMQRLTVRVMMLDDANKLVPNQSDVRVNVTGTVTDSSNVFWRGENQVVDGNTIEVGAYDETNKSEDSVYVAPNAKIDLETELNGSNYRVANVVAYQIDNNGNTKGDPIALTYSRTKSAGQDGEGGGIDFSLSTLPSMPVGQNVLITVYLARPVNMTVTIKMENENGIDVDGAPADSYVNVYGKNSQIGANEYTIVTDETEGKFNTKSITITDNPATRTVQIFQGSTLEAFANALLAEDWVIKKVTVTDKDGNEVGNLYTGESSQVTAEDTGNTFLRVKFGTRQQFLPNNNYTVTVYLAKAKSVIVTTSITNSTFASPTQAGSVEVYGENADIDTILFTRIDPTGTISANHYDAINTKRSDSYGYRSETKCIAKTELTVKVKPKNSNYIVGSFTAKLDNSEDLVCTPSEPDSDGVITYTLAYANGSAFEMNKLQDLYIDVEFTPVTSSHVTIDYWYTDDYKTMKPAPGSEVTTAYIEQHYGSSVYPNEPTVYDADNGVWVSGFTNIPANGTYDVLVGTRLYLGVHLINGNIYAPIENWIDRTDTATGKTSRETSYAMPTNGVNQDVSVKAGEDLFCHILLAPVSVIDFTQRDRNVVGDSPTGTDAIATTCYNNTKYCPEAKMELELDADLAAAVASGNINNSISGSMFHKNHYTSELTENTSNVVVFQGSSNLTVSLNKAKVDPGAVVSVKAYDGDTLVATLTETETAGVYTAPDNFVIEANKHYKVVVTMDCVDTWTSLNGTGEDAGVYLVTPKTADQNVKTIDIYNSETYGMLKQIKFGTGREQYRLDETWRNVTGPVYVIVQVSQPSGELNLDVAEWRDYYDDYAKDGKFDQKGGVNVKSEMLANYFTVQDGNGFTRYCYAFQITPAYPSGNTLPLDNSQHFAFTFFTPKTPSVHDTEDTPSTITLWQKKRTSNSDYVMTTDGTAVMTLADGSQFTYEGESVSSVQAPGHNRQESVVLANTVVGKSIRLQVTPPENCIVTKVVVTDDNGVHEYKPNEDNLYNIQVSFAKEEIVVYYSWPQITVSTNNKAGDEKGTVWKDAVTPENTDNLIVDSGVYMGSTLVEKGVNKQLVIEPKTYETENGVEDYQVAYVLVGRDGRNSMLPISSDLIVPDANGRITVELGEINTDVDVHVQFAKKTALKTMTLIVSHFVWDGSDWIPCNTTYHGTVTTVGTLEGVDDPILDENENPANPLVLEEDPSVTATVVQGTKLDFTAKPAELFLVDHVDYRLNSESTVTLSGTTVPGAERQFGFTAENYSVICVDVYYKEPVYKLTYHGNNNTDGNAPDPVENCFYNEGLTIADQGTLVKARNTFLGWSKNPEATEPEFLPGAIFHITENTDLYAVWEPMTRHKLVYSYKNRFVNDLDEVANRQYIVFVWLDSDQKVKVQNTDGTYAEQPTKQILKENAPYIDDLYKDCKWDFDNAKTVDNVTTIPAIQTLKKYKIYWEIAEEKTGESSSGTIDVSELKETNTAEIVKNGRKITCHYVDHPYNVLCPLRAVKRNGVTDFLYWQATDVDANGNLIEGTTKPVCYTEYYSYRITKDIYVEPVYYGDGTKGWDLTLGETIYSREQYTGELEEETEEGGNSTTGIEKTTVYDYVYTDYLISILSPYQELVDDINKAVQNENDESTQGEITNIQFGLVLERDTSYEYDHDQNENVVYPEKAQEDICSLLDGKKAEIGSGTSKKVSAEEKKREYFIFDRTDSATLLTNKNRIDVYIRFANNELNPKYAYNVYAYMIITRDDAQTVIVSKDVSRLNIYDYGHRIYSAFEVLPEPEDPDSTEPETLPSSAAAPAALYSDVDYADDGLIEDAEDMSEDATDNWSDEREPDVQEETDTDGYPTDDAENEDAPEVLDDTVLENDTEEILE